MKLVMNISHVFSYNNNTIPEFQAIYYLLRHFQGNVGLKISCASGFCIDLDKKTH